MNDILLALRKEKKILSDRIYTMELFIKKKSEVISKTPYIRGIAIMCKPISAVHVINSENPLHAALSIAANAERLKTVLKSYSSTENK